MRKIFKKLLLIFIALGLIALLYAKFIEPKMLITKNIQIQEGPNMTVAVFGDTHFGKHYDDENINKIVDKINHINADLVIFVGDFFDNYSRDFKDIDLDYLKEKLSEIKSKKIAVRGNHDIGGGIEFIYEDFMTEAGFEVLINESLYIEEFSLNIFGYDDALLGKNDMEFHNQNNDDYNLFVMHEPDGADNLTGNASGTVLSGHSHGGQVFLPFLTEKILPKGARKYSRGLYEKDETGLSNNVFVTTGIGTTALDFRFLTIPEIVVIEFGNN